MTVAAHRWFAVLTTVVVVAAVGWGFAVVGSPAERRLERMDERRLDDLRTIVREIEGLCVEHGETASLRRPLPESLADLSSQARHYRIALEDPTGRPYRYRVLDDRRFELCAEFNGPRNVDTWVFWNHPAGPHCFVVDILDTP